MMEITGLSHLFKWENLHNWWLTKYFFGPTIYMIYLHVIALLQHSINLSYMSLHKADIQCSV